MSRTRRAAGYAAGIGAGLIAFASVSACSPGGREHERSTAAPAVTVTRWWSAGTESAGSTIDPKHPDAGASTLHQSRQAYCRMLRDTLAAGKSILPSAVQSGGPALRTATDAFVADLQRVAPAPVARQWRLVGDALSMFVRSDGKSLGGAGSAQLSRAIATISADAKAHCGLDLSASTS